MDADTLLSIALGIGLSAACGFRVFVPLLIVSIASLTGNLHLSSGFAWIGTLPAALAFGTATIFEILAYYIPWLDHLLDTIATPAAVVAGVVASAAVFTDISPMLKWTLALIGGGGIAGLVQGATVAARVKSAALTGGLGNPVVATGELVGSVGTSLLSLAAPFLTVALVIVVLIVVFYATKRLIFGRTKSP
jgi:hypothetical protein